MLRNNLYVSIISSLTHWGRVTHIFVGNLTIIGSDNGLSPSRRQAITLTDVGILLIGPVGINFSEIVIEIHIFSFKKIHLKMSSRKMASILSRPQCVKSRSKDDVIDLLLILTNPPCLLQGHWVTNVISNAIQEPYIYKTPCLQS